MKCCQECPRHERVRLFNLFKNGYKQIERKLNYKKLRNFDKSLRCICSGLNEDNDVSALPMNIIETKNRPTCWDV